MDDQSKTKREVTQSDAEAAVRVLIEWAGDDPEREGLSDTPAARRALLRAAVLRLRRRPAPVSRTHVRGDRRLRRTDRALQRARRQFLRASHAAGGRRAHVGYLPRDRVVGISKLARVVQGFSRRLQIQEKLTLDIAEAIQDVLNPLGVGVMIEAEHSCMTLRGVNTPGSRLSTSRLLGVIRDDPRTRDEFLRAVGG